MKKRLTLALLFAALIFTLSADPRLIVTSIGYSPTSNSAILGIGMPIGLFSPNGKGTLMLKTNWRNKDYPKGFETETEPFDWWAPTGEEIWGYSIISFGYMIDVPTTNWLSLTPYLGYGTKHNYIQYLSSATGWHFYNHTQESLFDAGDRKSVV